MRRPQHLRQRASPGADSHVRVHPVGNCLRTKLSALPFQSGSTTSSAIVLVVCVWLLVAASTGWAQESWQSALSRMPLQTNTMDLNRTNCVTLILGAFQSNPVVKALVFMPGATDELYFFRRAHAEMTNADPSLLDAVVALTNQTYIRATFQPPLLLLHTSEDVPDNIATIKNESTVAKLHQRLVPDRLVFNDAGWDEVRAALKRKLSVGLRPISGTPDSGHFYRHNFAACGATEWEVLEAIALTDKTTFTVHWLTVHFEMDRRSGVVPGIKNLQAP